MMSVAVTEPGTVEIVDIPTQAAEAAAQEPLVDWIRIGKLPTAYFRTKKFSIRDVENALEATEEPTSIESLLRFQEARQER